MVRANKDLHKQVGEGQMIKGDIEPTKTGSFVVTNTGGHLPLPVKPRGQETVRPVRRPAADDADEEC